MTAKVFLAIAFWIGALLLLQTHYDSRRESQTLKSETQLWADRTAQLFVGAVEQSMLRGDGIKVKASIEDLKQRVPGVRVRIYDHRGIEVFGAAPPVPARAELPPDVAAVLEAPRHSRSRGSHVFRPLPNQVQCHKCHDSKSLLRGIIEVSFADEGWAARREHMLWRVATSGFVQLMGARRSELLNSYFADVARTTPAIEAIAVFEPEGGLAFGSSIATIDRARLQPLVQPGARPQFQTDEHGILALVPLPMEERCVACHDDAIGTIRGVLAMSLVGAQVPQKVAQEELSGVIETSLRYIMLSQLGRRIADFLDEVALIDAVDKLALYDDLGRLYWTTQHPTPPEQVAAVLASEAPAYRVQGSGLDERLQVIAPLVNKPGCVRCHGAGTRLRGAVSISVSTAIAEEARRASWNQRRWYTGFNLLGILLMLAGLLQYLVARPVKKIGDVAEQVGSGNLSVTVHRADPEGDEIARLGNRVNEMVRGLRTKMQLEKFVSKGTAEAAADAGVQAISRTGERRTVTVLFSDIRGFTSFSEQFEPETVVEMLNRMLRAQAQVVTEFGGDIDKFVGDELMAVFAGDQAATKAVSCAAQMLHAVHDARLPGETLSVGIGISAGDVVYGAIGHEERMDFTVIGDVVNTGARLCSAAAEDEILISEPVHDAVDTGDKDAAKLTFDPGEPLRLKGKREPLPVYKVSD